MSRLPVTADTAEESIDDRSSLIRDAQCILQSTVSNSQYVKYCQDILENNLSADRLKTTLSKLNAFLNVYEVNHQGCQSMHVGRHSRIFRSYPTDEVYMFVKRALTFLRNERELKLEVMDLTLPHT